MEHDLVLEGRVVTPGGVVDGGVAIDDGRISELGSSLRGSRRITADGCLIFPGFIDAHVHLREPGWERKEDFRTGSAAAVHGGVTTVADMPNNPVPADTPEAIVTKARLARGKASIDVKFYGGIPRKPEGLAKTSDMVIGYKMYLSETTGSEPFPSDDLQRVFKLVSATGRPLAVHCEDQSVIDRLRGRVGDGPGPTSYADARPPEAEIRAVRSVVGALKGMPGLRLNVCHASTADSLSVVSRGRAEGLKIGCEAALHHLYFSRKSLEENPFLRTNPPLRDESDRQALLSGLVGGDVSILATDHAPHLAEEKREGSAGVPGLDDFSHIVAWLIKSQRLDPTTVARVASANPAGFLQLWDRGEISRGRAADITVIDMHSPEVVRNDDVRSKCGWSPYEGREFPGRARWVVRKGQVLMDDFEQVS